MTAVYCRQSSRRFKIFHMEYMAARHIIEFIWINLFGESDDNDLQWLQKLADRLT